MSARSEKWTPGPLHHRETLADNSHAHLIFQDQDERKSTALVFSAHDAALYAAAPDLYGACAEFVRKCECGEARSTRSYEQMKAALAKARGEA